MILPMNVKEYGIIVSWITAIWMVLAILILEKNLPSMFIGLKLGPMRKL